MIGCRAVRPVAVRGRGALVGARGGSGRQLARVGGGSGRRAGAARAAHRARLRRLAWFYITDKTVKLTLPTYITTHQLTLYTLRSVVTQLQLQAVAGAAQWPRGVATGLAVVDPRDNYLALVTYVYLTPTEPHIWLATLTRPYS